jgi:DNA mismatch repair protein MutS2
VILLDELGTGTEPVQGAALACAVLQDLQEKGALVLATTHLTDIVGFVHRREGMVNASMEFDRETFTPLYRLKRGEPGQSHALEIARKYGLPGSVIERAHGMIGRMESEFHALRHLKAQRGNTRRRCPTWIAGCGSCRAGGPGDPADGIGSGESERPAVIRDIVAGVKGS